MILEDIPAILVRCDDDRLATDLAPLPSVKGKCLHRLTPGADATVDQFLPSHRKGFKISCLPPSPQSATGRAGEQSLREAQGARAGQWLNGAESAAIGGRKPGV